MIIESRGLRVVENPFLATFGSKQLKSIEFKWWMRGKCYYKRINKKLLKKYGWEKTRVFIVTNDAIYANRENIEFLKRLSK